MLGPDVGILSSGATRHVKGMIGVIEQPQRRARPKPLDQRPQQRQVGERVARALQEQHRDVHVEQVRCRADPTAFPMGEAGNRGRQGRARPAVAQQPAPATSCGRRTICRRRPAGAPGDAAPPRSRRPARSPARARADPAAWRAPPCRETDSAAWRCRARASSAATAAMNGCVIPGPGAMREHVAGARAWRRDQQAGDAVRGVDRNRHRVGGVAHGLASVPSFLTALSPIIP